MDQVDAIGHWAGNIRRDIYANKIPKNVGTRCSMRWIIELTLQRNHSRLWLPSLGSLLEKHIVCLGWRFLFRKDYSSRSFHLWRVCSANWKRATVNSTKEP